MKKFIIILIILLILLFPIPFKAKDGGTVTYSPISFVYRVTVYNRFTGEGSVMKGTKVMILGFTVYNETYTVSDS